VTRFKRISGIRRPSSLLASPTRDFRVPRLHHFFDAFSGFFRTVPVPCVPRLPPKNPFFPFETGIMRFGV
jgi:hypothetical protein